MGPDSSFPEKFIPLRDLLSLLFPMSKTCIHSQLIKDGGNGASNDFLQGSESSCRLKVQGSTDCKDGKEHSQDGIVPLSKLPDKSKDLKFNGRGPTGWFFEESHKKVYLFSYLFIFLLDLLQISGI